MPEVGRFSKLSKYNIFVVKKAQHSFLYELNFYPQKLYFDNLCHMDSPSINNLSIAIRD